MTVCLKGYCSQAGPDSVLDHSRNRHIQVGILLTYNSATVTNMSLPGLGIAGATVREAPTVIDNDKKRPSSIDIVARGSSIQSSPDLGGGHAPQPDFDPSIGAKPYSPFYRHATPSLSTEQLTWEARRANRYHSKCARDVEAQISPIQPQGSQTSKLSKLWTKKKQPWELLEGLSTRQRITAKALIAILTLGAMVGIALGITSAVGGVWKYDKHQRSFLG